MNDYEIMPILKFSMKKKGKQETDEVSLETSDDVHYEVYFCVVYFLKEAKNKLIKKW